MNDKREPDPVCPVCEESMVRTHYQNEEGDWFVCWLCGCLPDYSIINNPLEKAIQEAENILHKETDI